MICSWSPGGLIQADWPDFLGVDLARLSEPSQQVAFRRLRVGLPMPWSARFLAGVRFDPDAVGLVGGDNLAPN